MNAKHHEGTADYVEGSQKMSKQYTCVHRNSAKQQQYINQMLEVLAVAGVWLDVILHVTHTSLETWHHYKKTTLISVWC